MRLENQAGAGQAFDLEAGVRCIADGYVIAYRLERTHSVSDGPTGAQAPYSTSFALVRHSMEFPKGTTLTFYSLYMHLLAYDDYKKAPARKRPAYWSTRWQVSEFAKDKPNAGRNGQKPDAGQQGLRVRRSPRDGGIIGILPQGSTVSLDQRQNGWGRIEKLHGASLYPPAAGVFIDPSAAMGGWISLGQENGALLVREVMPESAFDRVVITASDAPDAGIPIKAGELIGHLGRYDSLNQGTAGTRMVHIEVFCDSGIQSFIEQGRAWVEEHGPHKEARAALGLPAEPTMLRVGAKTKLYRGPNEEGADASMTDVVQRYSLAELSRDKSRQFTEAQPDRSGRKVSWWHVESANAQGNPIHGWVREENFAGGRVTREFAQKWEDFQCLESAHDPAHTIFASAKAWVDYATRADVPEAAALAKLGPLMQQRVYRALFAKGDGRRAADDLCNIGKARPGCYPWRMQAASRLIVKHESEWANPGKWKQLIDALEKQTEVKPQHAQELKRIEKLAWWEEVKAGVPGFPGPEVFHIHPIAMVGNFAIDCDCKARFEKVSEIVLCNEGGFVNDPSDSGGATNHGIAWPTWQAYAAEDLGVEPTLENLKALSSEQAKIIYFKRYWESRGFCGIVNEKTALNIYDWTITSGRAIAKIQKCLRRNFPWKLLLITEYQKI